MKTSVLVVCEGNICRSPIAKGILAKAMPDVTVTSAGTHAMVGAPAHSIAIELAKERDIDLDDHVAAQISDKHVESAALILTMTKSQRAYIEANWPHARGRVYRLCEIEGFDVVDPFQRKREIFEVAFAQIEQGLIFWKKNFSKLVIES